MAKLCISIVNQIKHKSHFHQRKYTQNKGHLYILWQGQRPLLYSMVVIEKRLVLYPASGLETKTTIISHGWAINESKTKPYVSGFSNTMQQQI